MHAEDFLYDLERYFNELETKYNESIKHLKNSFDIEKKRNRNISAQQNSIFFVKSDMESLFLECVDEVKKEVNKRKEISFANQKFPIRNHTAQKWDKNLMTPKDKRKILELLVSNEKVLICLYEKLFPYRADQYGYTLKPENKPDDNEIPNLEELLKSVPSKPNTARIGSYSYRGKSIS